MSGGAEIFPLISEISERLDGQREKAERTLEALVAELKLRPPAERDEIRRQMILIIASLSRLEVRLIETDGPL
jgi:hypothetical protein